MRLTVELKRKVDAMSYEEMLRQWRFAKTGDELFEGESGMYVAKRMQELKNAPGGNPRHVAASKKIGWDTE